MMEIQSEGFIARGLVALPAAYVFSSLSETGSWLSPWPVLWKGVGSPTSQWLEESWGTSINTKAGLCSSCCVVSGLCCRKIMTHIRERIWAHLKICINWTFSSVQFSHSVMSNSLQAHELQHTRPPCPSPTPGVHSNSCPSSRWCHPTISSSVVPFSSWPQALPASESFPRSQLFAWGGQSIGVPA